MRAGWNPGDDTLTRRAGIEIELNSERLEYGWGSVPFDSTAGSFVNESSTSGFPIAMRDPVTAQTIDGLRSRSRPESHGSRVLDYSTYLVLRSRQSPFLLRLVGRNGELFAFP